jgi:hypothetical protein
VDPAVRRVPMERSLGRNGIEAGRSQRLAPRGQRTIILVVWWVVCDVLWRLTGRKEEDEVALINGDRGG